MNNYEDYIDNESNDFLAKRYISLKNRKKRADIELKVIQDLFDFRAEHDNSNSLHAKRYTIVKRRRTKGYDAALIYQELKNELPPEIGKKIIKTVATVDGKFFSKLARKFGGKTKEVYEASRLNPTEYWEVTKKK